MQNKVKTQEKFESLLNFTENEIKILENVRFSILSRIEWDKNYVKQSVKNVLLPKTNNLLDGFVLEKVLFLEIK